MSRIRHKDIKEQGSRDKEQGFKVQDYMVKVKAKVKVKVK
jgi:hypothetical protein